MIDLRRLHVLRVLQRQGTVTGAAELLHLTPSAVSHQLRQLAREVGVELVRQQGRLLHLTPAGQTLVRYADDLEAGWQRAHAGVLARSEGAAGTLRMGGFPSAVGTLLAPAATLLRHSAPDLQVRVSEVEVEPAYKRLLAGELDLAVTRVMPETPPLSDPAYDQLPLLTEPLDLVVAADHPLAGRAGVELAEAAHDPWVVPAADACDHHQVVVAFASAAGFVPRILHEVTDWYGATALVAQRFGVCLLPRYVTLSPDHAVVRVPLGGAACPVRHLLACVRRGSSERPGVADGLEALRAVAAELTDRHGGPLSATPSPVAVGA